MKFTVLFLISILFCSLSYSQEDIKGSKDHPLFNRMPGYRISSYENNEFGILKDFKNENGKKMSVEGHYYLLNYSVKKSTKEATGTQVFRNYKNAVKKAGGKVIYEDSYSVFLKLEKNNTITWIKVNSNRSARSYTVWIVEEAEMEQDIVVDANAMLNDINSKGSVALYGIYFDFDKSDVKPESDPTLKEIAKLLSDNAKINLFVVGHTDNVGDFNYNMKLSKSRAEAVVMELVSKYKIDKSRLTPAGVGPLCPVTSNDTEEGKAKNRRVELIKK